MPQSKLAWIVGELQRLQVRCAVQPVDRIVQLRQLQAQIAGRGCAKASITVRIIGTTTVAHLGDLLRHRLAPRQIAGHEVDLRDVHRLVADALQILSTV